MSEYAASCELGVPGVLQGTRTGWYLIAANQRVEAGPFADELEANAAAVWMDEHARGVNPAPWSPLFSRTGLQIGSRWRPTRPAGQAPV